MLTDRHMFAVNKLLKVQFPHVQGLHSTLLVQRSGFPPINISAEPVPDGKFVMQL